MRRLPFAALALLTCGGPSDRRDTPDARDANLSAPPQAPTGPDAVVLRVARAGGRVRAYIYPRLDSVAWTSRDAALPVARVLGFDESAGSLAVVDTLGAPQRLSLRLGSVAAPSRARFASLASADGYGIYGVNGGALTRLTPSDARPWSVRLTPAPRDVLPQADGSVLVVADRGRETLVWRLRPPEHTPVDTAFLPRVGRVIATPTGDRVYFVTDSGLVGLQSRTLEPVPAVRLEAPVRDAVATPSGDRLYLATDSSSQLQVVDRYRDEVSGTVKLPGPVAELRMDPLGRYLLARAAAGDSAWVVAIGTDRVVGAVPTAWRADLPLVAPDGMIATARGRDVVFVDGETLRERRTVRGGGADFWHVLLWNGFRPRPGDVDRPPAPADNAERTPRAVAANTDSAADTATAATPAPTIAAAASVSDSVLRRPAPPGQPAPAAAPGPAPRARQAGFTVQFAAARSEQAAREVASAVGRKGTPPRIVVTQTSGTTIYRVVLGPFATEAEAERAGKQSGRDYWVYAGEP